jgi:alkanesulfonate monooxygenase SsuD/methylene tetrahydromethanopterin reductase-like flavin-dependent oxidoreductase (luciferase family)
LYAAQIEPTRPCFDAVSCYSALAVLTSTVRVGTLVYCPTYRHPAVIAKAAVAIDHLSNGRLDLGLGAGWHAPEHHAFGFRFDPPARRLRRLKEAVELIRLLWREDVVEFRG